MLVQLSAHRIDVLNPDGELPETLLRQGEYVESRGLVSRILPQRTIDQQFIAQGPPGPAEPMPGLAGLSVIRPRTGAAIGLFKTELIKPRGPWRTVEQVEIAALEYVDWFNHRRSNETCGDIPPAELETAYYRQNTALAEAGQTAT